ncbi:hypothetical protein Godav_009664, partial [Gossypium davidsonii]|nr:hypothetical protein [Gossypium davidsonii]
FVLTVKASGGTGTGASFTSVLTAQIPSSLLVHSPFGLTVLPSSFRFTKAVIAAIDVKIFHPSIEVLTGG